MTVGHNGINAIHDGRAVWIDGDPLMEAIAAAVWEHCDTSGGYSIVTDDPRNIAAVAAHVARTAVRAETLRDAEEICDEAGAVYTSKALNEHADAAYTLMERFRRKAEEAERNAAALPAPGNRAAVLLWAADQIDAGWLTTAATATAELRRLAGEAQQDEAQDGEADVVRRETVEYFVQAQQPDGSWEQCSSTATDREFATERVAARRRMQPGFTYRIAERTTAVVVRAVAEDTTPPV